MVELWLGDDGAGDVRDCILAGQSKIAALPCTRRHVFCAADGNRMRWRRLEPEWLRRFDRRNRRYVRRSQLDRDHVSCRLKNNPERQSKRDRDSDSEQNAGGVA